MTATLDLTERQQQVLELLNPPHNMAAREIGEKLDISRNAVYQTINRLEQKGVWTKPGNTPARSPGRAVMGQILPSPNDEDAQRNQGSVPLSAQLLSEIQQTQQDLARIANRLQKYLS